MRIFIAAFLSLFSAVTFSQTHSSQIHDIDISARPGDPILIFFSSGLIGKISQNETSELDSLYLIKEQKKWIDITLSDSREIIHWEISKKQNEKIIPSKHNAEETYIPSILGNLEWAQLYFRESRLNTKDSQCYNRAHVWTHDWRQKHKFFSSKVWIFFTRKYIREFDFEWWFHVAPYVHVVIDGAIKERIMDIKYARGPLNSRQWSNIFMRNDAPCPTVNKYSDQANYPEAGHCFLMKSSMYYYQPVDLELLELKGIQKNYWIPTEVKQAYLEAFDTEI